MHAVAVQNQDKLSSQSSVKRAEKWNHLLRANVVRMNLKIKPQPPTLGRDGNSRDNREPIMVVPTVLDGRLTCRSPRSATYQLQHKAAFIWKNDAISLLTRFFLYAANPAIANAEWPARRVCGLAVRAFDSSSPANAGCARYGRDDTSPQRSGRLPRPPAGRSIALRKSPRIRPKT